MDQLLERKAKLDKDIEKMEYALKYKKWKELKEEEKKNDEIAQIEEKNTTQRWLMEEKYYNEKIK